MNITFKQQGNRTKSWYVDGELTYESPVNTYHNNMLQGYLDELNYLSIGELAMWINDVEYGAEAQALINWWITTCKLVAEYVDLHPKEETATEFILTIPKLTL